MLLLLAGLERHLFAGYFHVCVGSKLLHRIRKAQAVEFHDKLQRTAGSAAAEAVVELFVRADGKRGCVLIVKRAAGGVVFSGLL